MASRKIFQVSRVRPLAKFLQVCKETAMEEESPHLIAAIQGFAALIFGIIGVLGLSALVCALLYLAIKAITFL